MPSDRTSRERLQPSVFSYTADWINEFANRWGVSRDVAAARILDSVAESPWTNLILKEPGTDIVIEKMEVLLKRKDD